jgi:hypothetical protein
MLGARFPEKGFGVRAAQEGRGEPEQLIPPSRSATVSVPAPSSLLIRPSRAPYA